MIRFDASRVCSIFAIVAVGVLYFAVICLAVSAGDDKKADNAQPADVNELQGKWILIEHEIDGRRVPVPKDNWFLIEGVSVVRRYANGTYKGQIKVDSKANPKRLDFHVVEWFDPCIYRFDSFKLEICGPPFQSKERPTRFDSKNNRRIEIYMRDMR